jgi:hypothetical protein
MTVVRSASYKYTLDSNPSRLIYTGRRGEQDRILIAPLAPRMLVLVFDEEGRLRHAEVVNPEVEDQEAFDHAARVLADEVIDDAKAIEICRFDSEDPMSPLAKFDAEGPLQITDLPFDLSYSDGEATETKVGREQWLSSQNYVLTWGNDYYVNSMGVIFSS